MDFDLHFGMIFHEIFMFFFSTSIWHRFFDRFLMENGFPKWLAKVIGPAHRFLRAILATLSESLSTLWMHFGRPLAPFWILLAPFGSLWLPFGSLLAPFGSLLAPFGSLLAPFWLPFGSLLAPFGSLLAPFWLPFGSLLATFWLPLVSRVLAPFWLDFMMHFRIRIFLWSSANFGTAARAHIVIFREISERQLQIDRASRGHPRSGTFSQAHFRGSAPGPKRRRVCLHVPGNWDLSTHQFCNTFCYSTLVKCLL